MPIILSNIHKSYGELAVLRNLSLSVPDGSTLCLMGPSGCGKTTLLRLLLGLELPDAGTITGITTVSAQFQEDRLLEDFSVMDNLRFVLGRSFGKEPEALLSPLLPGDCFEKPARELSGGMRRRLALIRALAVPSALLVLDEPFTGLDEAARAEAIRYIHRHRRGRTLIAATHREADAADLHAEILHLTDLNQPS